MKHPHTRGPEGLGYEPKLTIITPSYNQGRFLEETIQSVLGQGYNNLEYIIIDGGSVDESRRVIEKYQRHLAYWVSEPDQGQSHALNKGLAHATGEIVGWVNSDDRYTPGSFQKVIRAFRTHTDAGVVHGDRLLIDERSRVCGWTHLPRFNPERYGFNVCSETAFWRADAIAHDMFRADLRFAMDLEFFSRLYRRGVNFVKIDEFLGCFRCYEGNKSSTIADVGRKEAAQAWSHLFPETPETWRVVPPASRLRHSMQLFRHPFLLAAPYFRWKFAQI